MFWETGYIIWKSYFCSFFFFLSGTVTKGSYASFLTTKTILAAPIAYGSSLTRNPIQAKAATYTTAAATRDP